MTTNPKELLNDSGGLFSLNWNKDTGRMSNKLTRNNTNRGILHAVKRVDSKETVGH
jgi:hypothetical protein